MNVNVFFKDDSGVSQELLREIFEKIPEPEKKFSLFIIHDMCYNPFFAGIYSEIPDGLRSALLHSKDENNLVIFVSDMPSSAIDGKYHKHFSALIERKNVVFFQTPITIFGITEKYNELLEKNLD